VFAIAMATTAASTELYGNQTEVDGDGASVDLHWADYLVLSLVLGFTVLTGFLFRFLDRKKKSQNDFFFGSKSMSFFPVAVSLFMSGWGNVTVLQNSLEAYNYGVVYALSAASCILATPIIAHTFAALFHLMELSTSFQVGLREKIRYRFLNKFFICFSSWRFGLRQSCDQFHPLFTV
jgi:Na+/pantothenate symporter